MPHIFANGRGKGGHLPGMWMPMKGLLHNFETKMDSYLSYQQLPVSNLLGSDVEMLDVLLRKTFDYFLKEINSENGLIADKNKPGWPSSIAAVGLGLSTYIVGVERGLLLRINFTLRCSALIC